MAKVMRKRMVKPKEDKQLVDGLALSFEEAMKVLSLPKPPIKFNPEKK
jgi:hypothetical protein